MGFGRRSLELTNHTGSQPDSTAGAGAGARPEIAQRASVWAGSTLGARPGCAHHTRLSCMLASISCMQACVHTRSHTQDRPYKSKCGLLAIEKAQLFKLLVIFPSSAPSTICFRPQHLTRDRAPGTPCPTHTMQCPVKGKVSPGGCNFAWA